MNYCPNCGNKLNENDKFCSNCGYKLEESNDSSENIYGEVIIKQEPKKVEPLTKKHSLSIVGFIFGIISLCLLIIAFVIIGIYHDSYQIPTVPAFIGGLCIIFTFITGAAALGTSIPGLVISKRRNGPCGFAIAALIVSAIPCAVVLVLMILSEL